MDLTMEKKMLTYAALRYDSYNNRYYHFEVSFRAESVTHIEEVIEHGYYGSKSNGNYKVFLDDGCEPFIISKTEYKELIEKINCEK